MAGILLPSGAVVCNHHLELPHELLEVHLLDQVEFRYHLDPVYPRNHLLNEGVVSEHLGLGLTKLAEYLLPKNGIDCKLAFLKGHQIGVSLKVHDSLVMAVEQSRNICEKGYCSVSHCLPNRIRVGQSLQVL